MKQLMKWAIPVGAGLAVALAGAPTAHATQQNEWVTPGDSLQHITSQLGGECGVTLQLAIQFTHVGPTYDHIQGLRMTLQGLDPHATYAKVANVEFIGGSRLDEVHWLNPRTVFLDRGESHLWLPNLNLANGPTSSGDPIELLFGIYPNWFSPPDDYCLETSVYRVPLG